MTNKFVEKLKKMSPEICSEELEKIIYQVEEIRKLKEEKNAVILSHYYMPSYLQIETYYGGVADFTGDSLGLSLAAKNVTAENIIFCGVVFMAETAKILNAKKNIFIPSPEAGCSLAWSISAEDIRFLKHEYPGVPVMAYINTYAETKAECDICCTSRNAMQIARSLDGDRIIFVPDYYMGKNLQKKIFKETGKELILWNGSCEVHEQFTPAKINSFQTQYPAAEILVHWEVPDETVEESFLFSEGILGSTSDIIKHVGKSKSKEFIIGSECDLGATLRGLYPDRKFVTPCISCPYMKKISLENTLRSLEAIGTENEEKYIVEIPEEIRLKAEIPIQRMLQYS